MKPRSPFVFNLSFPLASAIAALLACQSGHAAPYSWTGATNGAWNTGSNWSGSSVPLITDDLTILGPLNVAGALTMEFDADNSANSLNFTNTAATSITNTTSGANRTLTLGSGGITTGSGAVQIGANVVNQAVNITLNAAQTWNVGSGGLTVTNLIDGASTGITKTGTGNLTINTATSNTFTGGINVNGGTVTLNYGNLATPTNLIAATNALQVNNGTLTITGKNVAAATTVQTFAGTTLGAGRNTINIAKGASATSATLNLGALTANVGSTTIFSPTTAWTTTASTTERVFITAGGSVPSLPGGATTAFVNPAVFHRVPGGAVGSLRLAAVNSSGQLLLRANTGNLAIGTTGTSADSYQLAAGSIALTNSANIYGLLLNATTAGATVTVANSGTLTLNSVIQIKSTENVIIAPGTGTSNLVIGSAKNLVLAMDNAAGLSITAPIIDNGGGASGVTVFGSAPSGTPGAVTFGGANSFTGPTTLTNATLSLTNATALGGNNPGVNGTSAISISAGSVLSSALGGANPSTTVSAPITLGAGGNTTLRIGQGAAANTHTFNINGAIGGATNNLVFTTSTNSFNNGSSVFVIGAAGTYTGNTLITSGNGGNNPVTVRNGVTNALPTTTVLTMTGGAGLGSGRNLVFDLNGFDQTLAGLTHTLTIPDDRQYRVTSTAAATLTINNTADFSFGGATIDSDVPPTAQPGTTTSAQITGAISLVKNGTGTFTLGGTLTNGATAQGNSFTGDTRILGGILVLGESTSLRNSAFDTGASIAGDATNGLRATPTTLTLGGLKGANDFSTRFTTTSGGYTGLTALTLNPGTGASHTYSGDIGDGATGMNLSKTGAGTQTLTGTITHTGTTAVSAGVLAVNGTLANTSTATVSGTGTLKGGGSINSSVTINSGGTLASGTSIESLAIGGDLSFTTGSAFEYELDKDAAASVAGDLTAVTGSLSLAGTVTLNVIETGIGSWELGMPIGDHFGSPAADKLTLISYNGTWNGGLFTYLGNLVPDDSGILINGQQWWFNYNDTDAGTNFTGDLGGATRFVTITVPEPRAALLGGIGMLVLLRRRRG
jgi:autotransporter-associated beta strand protein